jgi:hypothetical protein
MVTSDVRRVDYYAVLQVHPDAEFEVIEAAYRQLMRKYHPDMAGADHTRADALHQRAKSINEAYAVLRDPQQRRMYDGARPVPGFVPAAPPPSDSVGPDRTWTAPRPRATVVPQQPAARVVVVDLPTPSTGWGLLEAPLAALSAAYYMLPGPYEWEENHQADLLAALILPPLGILGWALATGRLDHLLGPSPFALPLAWAALVLVALPAWKALPALIPAAAPAVVLQSGTLDGMLASAAIPHWTAWLVVSGASMVLGARRYVFAVLPTLGMCSVLSRLF